MNIFRFALSLMLSFTLSMGCAQQNPSTRKASPVHPGAVFPAKHRILQKDTLRILSWNVEHFVDGFDDPYVNNYIENKALVDSLKMSRIADILKAAKADVVMLQEAESANWAEVAAKSYFPELGYRYFSDARSRDWYQNVVLMSRVPLGVVYSYGQVHTPVKFTEDSVEVYQTQDYINTRMWSCDLLVNEDYHLIITGLHLKAGRKDRDLAMRMGQIEFLKGQLERFSQSYRKPKLLVVGDLNSLPDSKEIELMLEGGSRKVRLSDPLPSNLHSHPADQPSRRLDYMLYNRYLAPDVIAESAQIFSPLPAQQMREASDHLPLILELKVR